MEQYLNLVKQIKETGTWKPAAREFLPRTLGISHGIIEHDMAEGFPLLTCKKMYFKGIVTELLWFLRGETNIKFLVDNNVNIWNGDAYRWYLEQAKERGVKRVLSKTEFLDYIKINPDASPFGLYSGGYKFGDLGKVYGYQWRNQNGIDQISEIIKSLIEKPFSRYHILDAWNKADFPEMALPPCHLLWQFIVRKEGLFEYLDLNMYQRSCDTFLGVPFDLGMMGLMLMIISEVVNMTPGRILWLGGDTHLYENHMEQVDTLLKREPKKLPQVKLNKRLYGIEDIMTLEYSDFSLTGYEPHPAIKAKLSTGLKDD